MTECEGKKKKNNAWKELESRDRRNIKDKKNHMEED